MEGKILLACSNMPTEGTAACQHENFRFSVTTTEYENSKVYIYT